MFMPLLSAWLPVGYLLLRKDLETGRKESTATLDTAIAASNTALATAIAALNTALATIASSDSKAKLRSKDIDTVSKDSNHRVELLRLDLLSIRSDLAKISRDIESAWPNNTTKNL